MFVIKNLDTGLEMRIDDFDKLANIATEEVQVRANTGSMLTGPADAAAGAIAAAPAGAASKRSYALPGYQVY
jgi:hypothetical protein